MLDDMEKSFINFDKRFKEQLQEMDKKDEMKKLMEDSDEDGQDYGIPFDLNKIR